MILSPKVEKLIGRHKSVGYLLEIQDQRNDGLNEYQLARFLEVQNSIYGDSIDKQMEIRKCIDYLYFNNMWVLRVLFFIFIGGFLIPFFAQMLPSNLITPLTDHDQNHIVKYLNNVCLGTIIFMLIHELG